MAVVPGPGIPITRVAGADLSAHQFRIVKQNSAGEVIPMAAITDIPFGILQNAPASGENASVMPIGYGQSKIELGATLAIGALISSGTTGLGVAAASTSYPVGQLIDGGAVNELGTISLMSLTVKA